MVVTRASEHCCVREVATRSNHEAFGVATKSVDFEKRPASGIGRLMVLMSFPFLPEKVLPFDLKAGGQVPGAKPPIHLCHGMVQVITLVWPDCVLKIGFREK